MCVGEGGIRGSPCLGPAPPPPQNVSIIPPLLGAAGFFTRFGCRTGTFSIPGFGASQLFGGFPGAQCCAARANGVDPPSAPDGHAITTGGDPLFVANGRSTCVDSPPVKPPRPPAHVDTPPVDGA